MGKVCSQNGVQLPFKFLVCYVQIIKDATFYVICVAKLIPCDEWNSHIHGLVFFYKCQLKLVKKIWIRHFKLLLKKWCMPKAGLPCDKGAIYSYAKIVMEKDRSDATRARCKFFEKKTLLPIPSFSGIQKVRKFY